jgi:hypothetical protein
LIRLGEDISGEGDVEVTGKMRVTEGERLVVETAWNPGLYRLPNQCSFLFHSAFLF